MPYYTCLEWEWQGGHIPASVSPQIYILIAVQLEEVLEVPGQAPHL